MRLDRVTLCIADTRNHELAREAMRATLARCGVARALFLSDRDPALPGVTHVPIAPIESRAAYGALVLKRLLPLVETSHALLIQWDGFVLDPGAWTDEFLLHDYIGAPWPQHAEHAVGNGGFSLRSRRLLAALADPAFQPDDTPEDLLIARAWRPALESRHGIRFAPRPLARRFSRESEGAERHFGFHGVYHLHLHYRGARFAALLRELTPEVLCSWRAVRLLGAYAAAGLHAEAASLRRAVEAAQGAPALRATAARLGLAALTADLPLSA